MMPIVMTGGLIAITLLRVRAAAIVVMVGPLWLDITPFNDLVEFAAIEPDAPALGAVVDLDALPFGHR